MRRSGTGTAPPSRMLRWAAGWERKTPSRRSALPARREIDIEEVKKWARAGATQEEIASRLKITKRTLTTRLQEVKYRHEFACATAELKISLRSKQVALALAGNVTMLIWLGKNLLGQTDKWD